MGHIDVKRLKRATTGLPIDAVEVKSCRVCALANIKRLKFPSRSHTRADRPLFRVHADICGPLPPGFGSFRYFIPFIDDYSRYIWIFFLKSRSDAVKAFDEFRLAAEKYLGFPLSSLRVDNAPELVSGAFELYCKAHGISYERPVPDAHQQNGVAERAIQTIELSPRICTDTIEYCQYTGGAAGTVRRLRSFGVSYHPNIFVEGANSMRNIP